MTKSEIFKKAWRLAAMIAAVTKQEKCVHFRTALKAVYKSLKNCGGWFGFYEICERSARKTAKHAKSRLSGYLSAQEKGFFENEYNNSVQDAFVFNYLRNGKVMEAVQ
ncbi:hypothetical protein PLEI_2964 [Photobacterium leiognathi lrivu.4.1]|uniref:Uncharacterized protein n=1 Tax=Photobacterium leiognathi lrivu.4.1 TaxID=1248232 RepID=V5ENI0_PHOLE|nr:hypothetical protein [Photobacterium leiognathi]GAD31306.1 hypothetical protein PLEI_2964 [Photobacterium leiognathi lrivu.4.1]